MLTEGRANNRGIGSWPCVLEPDFLEHSFPELLWVPWSIRWARGNPWALLRIDAGSGSPQRVLIRKANRWTSQEDPGAPLSWNERQRAGSLIGMHRAHALLRIATGQTGPQKHLQAGFFEPQPPNPAAFEGQRWHSHCSALTCHTKLPGLCVSSQPIFRNPWDLTHGCVRFDRRENCYSGTWCNSFHGASPTGKAMLPTLGLSLPK